MFIFGLKLEVCAPDGATVRQALTAIVRYIDERPERMREHFELLALEAVQQVALPEIETECERSAGAPGIDRDPRHLQLTGYADCQSAGRLKPLRAAL